MWLAPSVFLDYVSSYKHALGGIKCFELQLIQYLSFPIECPMILTEAIIYGEGAWSNPFSKEHLSCEN